MFAGPAAAFPLVTGLLEVVSFGQPAVADESGCDGDKGSEVVGPAFIAAV